MKQYETKEYKKYEIYLNTYNEYCVCREKDRMLTYNSSFKTEDKAKKYIDKIEETLEDLANKLK